MGSPYQNDADREPEFAPDPTDVSADGDYEQFVPVKENAGPSEHQEEQVMEDDDYLVTKLYRARVKFYPREANNGNDEVETTVVLSDGREPSIYGLIDGPVHKLEKHQRILVSSFIDEDGYEFFQLAEFGDEKYPLLSGDELKGFDRRAAQEVQLIARITQRLLKNEPLEESGVATDEIAALARTIYIQMNRQ